jgi:hypothetical protein
MAPTNDQRQFRQIFLERKSSNASAAHASTLVQAFRDSRISGATVRERFSSILGLTGSNLPGPSPHFDDYAIRQIGTESSATGVGDTGFRRELRDSIHYHRDASGGDISMHRLSSDQIGHFLTAAHIGFFITEGNNYLRERRQEADRYRAAHPYRSIVSDLIELPTLTDMQIQHAFMSGQYQSAMIGHELVADRAFSGWGISSTIAAPFSASDTDISNFFAGRLDLIRVNDSQRGNSYQDLLLTWIGYRFGERMSNDAFPTRDEAARWLELMLMDRELNAVQKTDPFYSDAQQMQAMLQQFREIQRRIHP